MSPNGTIAAVHVDQLGAGDYTWFLDEGLHYTNHPAYPDLAPPDTRAVWGSVFSPQGKVFVIPRQDSIDFIDVGSGKMRARFVVPEPLITPQNVVDVKNDLAIDATGLSVFAISQSGITVVQFDSPIDELPQPEWPLN